MIFSNTGLALGGAAAATGLIAGLWSQVRFTLRRAWSLVFVSVRVEGSAARALQAYCWKNMRRSPLGGRRYTGTTQHVRPRDRVEEVGLEIIGEQSVTFWRDWRPLVFAALKQYEKNIELAPTVFSMTFLRGTFQADSLIDSALEYHNSAVKLSDRLRFAVHHKQGSGPLRQRGLIAGNAGVDGVGKPNQTDFTPDNSRVIRWRKEDLGVALAEGEKAMDSLAFPAHISDLPGEMRRWKESQNWYRRKQMPWTRGWLLYGQPGTGKTSLVRAIAEDLDLPIYVFDLSGMSNQELRENWRSMQVDAPCIALIEDIDGIFNGRQNVLGENGGGLTFDCLLNCLSGIEGCSGVFKVVTTNKIEMVDPALGVPSGSDAVSTRPGRLDRAIELLPMEENSRRTVAERILSDCPSHIDRLIVDGAGDTPAQFVERCGQVAIKEFWKRPGRNGNGHRISELVPA